MNKFKLTLTYQTGEVEEIYFETLSTLNHCYMTLVHLPNLKEMHEFTFIGGKWWRME